MSDARSAFHAALSKAQGAIEGAKKDVKNDFFKSRYADLASVWEACRKQLSENGLAVLQFPDYDDKSKTVCVETIITHSAGYQMSFKTRVPVAKQDAQGVGSGITYARRYALMAAVGIAPEDDDGNAAANTGYNEKTGKFSASSLKKEGAWEKFTSRVDELAAKNPHDVLDYWQSENVQKYWIDKPQAWRDEAQAYVEAAIEERLGQVAAQ